MSKKSVVLLSGGLDSATVLYYAKKKKYNPYGLIFDYGQRHDKEIEHAKKIARRCGCSYKVVKISMPWLGSSLVDKSKNLPQRKIINPKEIPSTYVPARNIIFLSFAFGYAEVLKAGYVFIGANAVDYSGYPDCRPDFMKAYEKTVKLGTKSGVQGKAIKILTPLISKSKAQIIKMGHNLDVPYELTWSCYKGSKKACGVCDSCILRAKGFTDAKLKDPAL